MQQLTFAGPVHGISDVTLEFADKLGSITPGNLNYIKGFSDGSKSIVDHPEQKGGWACQILTRQGHC